MFVMISKHQFVCLQAASSVPSRIENFDLSRCVEGVAQISLQLPHPKFLVETRTALFNFVPSKGPALLSKQFATNSIRYRAPGMAKFLMVDLLSGLLFHGSTVGICVFARSLAL